MASRCATNTAARSTRQGLKQIEAISRPPSEGHQAHSAGRPSQTGLVEIFDPIPAYVEQIHRLIDLQPIKDAGLTVMVDPMWGNGAGWFQRLLDGGKTRIEIHNVRNPIYPEMSRPEPIPPNVNVGLQATLDNRPMY
jgi:phosphomannomutase